MAELPAVDIDLVEQLRRDRALQRGEEPVLHLAAVALEGVGPTSGERSGCCGGRLPEHGEVERCGDHGGEAQDVLTVGAEPVDAAEHDVARWPRNRVGRRGRVVVEGGHELLEEERVAAAAVGEGTGDREVDTALPHEFGGRVVIEGQERQVLDGDSGDRTEQRSSHSGVGRRVARRDVALEPMTEKKSAGRTKAGVELTEDVLNRLAAEAESELDLSKLRRRPGRPSMGSGPADTLPVRLDPELRKAVDDRAVADDTTTSDVVREALRQYLIAG